jgi:eukaryotic-like serine/threonine-protein kinase
MAPFARDDWQTLEPLLDHALELSPEERSGWLEELSARSPVLAGELSGLLAEEAQADRDGFLAGQPEVSAAGLALGAYTLERPLGRGGMGTVWLAHRSDGRFEGVAAVKLLNLALLSGAGQERFRREGSTLARLTHPGIARLLDAGVSGAGQPYLVLEYVDGRPIDTFVREQELPLGERIRLFLQVLAAVEHAHASLIVHRDLKPSNILVTADGTVKLLDFGIAKLLSEEAVNDRSAITLEGGHLFTPLYASPEQVRDEALTTASDVYALGVLLYVLLSGRHPTAEQVRTPMECVTALLEVEPAPLGLGDLDSILAKALRKEQARRYQSVVGFADDLTRYLRQEPVGARPDSLAYRAGKFVRRNRTGVLMGGLMSIGLISATVFSLAQMHEARHQRDAALRAGRRSAAQVEFQNALLSQVGEAPITMREALDASRRVLDLQFAGDSSTMAAMLLQLASGYGDLHASDVRGRILARADSLALAGFGAERLATIRCLEADNLRLDGKYKEAWARMATADSTLRPAPDPTNEAACLDVRAALADETGRSGEAVAAARRAMAIKDSLGETGDADYFGLFNTLGSALEGDGQLREARRAYERAIGAMDASGRGSTSSRSVIRHNIGVLLTRLGLTSEAERALREVLDRLAGSDPSGRMPWQPLIHYAEVVLFQDQPDTALKYFSMIVRQALPDSNLYWEGRGLFGVARAQIRRGRLAEARRARERLDQIIRAYPHVLDTDDVLPDIATLDGLLHLAEGDTAAAGAAFMAVLRTHGYFEGKLNRRLRPVALLAARSALALRRDDEALDLARRVGTQAAVDSLSERESAHVGAARLIEARALLARGDSSDARATIARALPALRIGAGPEHPLTREAEALSAALGR